MKQDFENQSFPNLEKMAKNLSSTSRGTIKIISENPFCSSCSGVIEQFQQMFPKVQLVLREGGR